MPGCDWCLDAPSAGKKKQQISLIISGTRDKAAGKVAEYLKILLSPPVIPQQ